MRFMVIVKANPDSENNVIPDGSDPTGELMKKENELRKSIFSRS